MTDSRGSLTLLEEGVRDVGRASKTDHHDIGGCASRMKTAMMPGPGGAESLERYYARIIACLNAQIDKASAESDEGAIVRVIDRAKRLGLERRLALHSLSMGRFRVEKLAS